MKSVLIGHDELPKSLRSDRDLPIAEIQDAIDVSSGAEQTPNGILHAAELLLTEPGIEIYFVATDKTIENYRGEPSYERRMLLGFNDHAGEVGSDFKVLVNRCVDGSEDPEQFVLYSPPPSDGATPNLVFHRSSFLSLYSDYQEPEYLQHGPAVLKTLETARKRGRDDYRYSLFGNGAVPRVFTEVLEGAGFTFASSPYTFTHTMELQGFAADAGQMRGNDGQPMWPHRQFGAQIAQLTMPDPETL